MAAQIRALGRHAHVHQADATRRGTSAEAVIDAAAAMGRLDILVATAGIFDHGALADSDDARFDASFDVHVRSVLEAARAAAPRMTDGGSIITFSTILADTAAFPGLALYTASKAAVAGLTRALARKLAPQAITANAIQPGPIDTEMNPPTPPRTRCPGP